jgi:hypothetical protein
MASEAYLTADRVGEFSSTGERDASGFFGLDETHHVLPALDQVRRI